MLVVVSDEFDFRVCVTRPLLARICKDYKDSVATVQSRGGTVVPC